MADDLRFGAFLVGEVAAAFSVSVFFGRPRPFFAAIISSFLTFRIEKIRIYISKQKLRVLLLKGFYVGSIQEALLASRVLQDWRPRVALSGAKKKTDLFSIVNVRVWKRVTRFFFGHTLGKLNFQFTN